MKLSYHVSHEQFSPKELLNLVKIAEASGFKGAMSSDHFHPWNDEQGHSGFAWSWLGAAMEATSLTFGVVNAPGQRYHPAIIAQAGATLAQMYPGRFWISLGSGQAINEGITGTYWPNKVQRNARLEECVHIIRSLWRGEVVNHKGLVRVDNAKLYTLPEKMPLIVGAALSVDTAYWLGSWADGLITINHPIDKTQKVVDAFRQGGGEGKPMFLKFQLSYDTDEETALFGAHEQWRTNIFPSDLLAELRTPDQFEAAGAFVKPEELYDYVKISADIEKHTRWIEQYMSLGFDEIILHNVNRNQERFIRDFGAEVIPNFRHSELQTSETE